LDFCTHIVKWLRDALWLGQKNKFFSCLDSRYYQLFNRLNPKVQVVAYETRAGVSAMASRSSMASSGGETNEWAPMIFDRLTIVEPPHVPGCNFMTDKAVA
jgi:hypothetical protein